MCFAYGGLGFLGVLYSIVVSAVTESVGGYKFGVCGLRIVKVNCVGI